MITIILSVKKKKNLFYPVPINWAGQVAFFSVGTWQLCHVTLCGLVNYAWLAEKEKKKHGSWSLFRATVDIHLLYIYVNP